VNAIASTLLGWIAGGVLALVAIVLIHRSLFHDRSNGRRRCPRCWHDMTASLDLRCTECGHASRSERDLFRTRRSWGRAFAVAAALVVIATAVRVRTTGENLLEYAPTFVLFWGLEHASTTTTPPDAIQSALEARLLDGRLDRSERDRVVDLVLEGDPDALPGSVAWSARYERLIGGLVRLSQNARDRGDLDDPVFGQLERLRALPPRVVLAPLAPGPVGTPLQIDLRVEEWWPATTYARVRIAEASGGAGVEHVIGLDSGSPWAPPFTCAFGPIGDGETSRTFEVVVEARATTPDGLRDPNAPWGTAHASTHVVRVAAQPGPPPAPLVPVRTDAMDEAIRAVFGEGIVVWRSGLRRLGLRFDPSRTSESAFEGVLVGLDVRIFEGDVVRRHSRMWWPGAASPRAARWEIVAEDLGALERLDTSDARWSVEIAGNGEIAERARGMVTGGSTQPTSYWSGTLRFPLGVQRNEGPAPRRRWFVLPPDDHPARPMSEARRTTDDAA
jgi:hypothetical protein